MLIERDTLGIPIFICTRFVIQIGGDRGEVGGGEGIPMESTGYGSYKTPVKF